MTSNRVEYEFRVLSKEMVILTPQHGERIEVTVRRKITERGSSNFYFYLDKHDARLIGQQLLDWAGEDEDDK